MAIRSRKSVTSLAADDNPHEIDGHCHSHDHLTPPRSLLIFFFVTSLSTFILTLVYDTYRAPILSYLQGNLPSNPSAQFIESCLLLPPLLLVPITHLIGNKRNRRLKGGFTFVVLQAFTWSFYSVGVVVLFLFVYSNVRLAGVLSSVAMLGVFAQGLMVSSIMAFESDSDLPPPPPSNPDESESEFESESESESESLMSAEMWVDIVNSNSPDKDRSTLKNKNKNNKKKKMKNKNGNSKTLAWASSKPNFPRERSTSYGQFVPLETSRPRSSMKRYKLLDFASWGGEQANRSERALTKTSILAMN